MIESVFKVADQFLLSPAHVSIDYNKLAEVGNEFRRSAPKPWKFKDFSARHVIEYELMASCINYCYWYGRYDVRPTGGGATEMYKLLDDAWKTYSNDTSTYTKGCATTLRLVYLREKLIQGRYPLLEQRIKHLDQLKGAVGFITDLAAGLGKPNFDIDTYIQRLCQTVPGFAGDIFLKRATLFFMMIQRRTKWMPDEQIRRLPIPADYQVPKMLRWMGVLKYSSELSNKVDTHELIPAGSLMECEIRAASIVACEALSAVSGKSMCEVDDYLWTHRKDCDDPFHLTITTDY